MQNFQQQLLKRYQRYHQNYHDQAVMVHEIGDRLLARLAYLKLIPQTILDLGCATGYDSQQLHACYPLADIYALDLSEALVTHYPQLENLQAMVADVLKMPIANQSVDLIFANLLLPAIIDYPQLWQECLRVLKPGGILLFSALGVDSFKELRHCATRQNQMQIVNAFVDMHDLGDGLIQARFSDPVIDRENLTLTYPNLITMLQELKILGSLTLLEEYQAHYLGKHFWTNVEQTYQQSFANAQGRLTATLEVYYGLAFAPLISSKDTSSETSIAIQSIKRLKREVS